MLQPISMDVNMIMANRPVSTWETLSNSSILFDCATHLSTEYADMAEHNTPKHANSGRWYCSIGFAPDTIQLAVPSITPYAAVLPATASMTLAGVISGLEEHVTIRLRFGNRGLVIILTRRGVITIFYHYDEFSKWCLIRISFSCVSSPPVDLVHSTEAISTKNPPSSNPRFPNPRVCS